MGSHKPLDSRHPIESCTLQLHSWRPFQLQTLDSDSPKPYIHSNSNGVHTIKRPCLSDRATSFPPIDSLDMSKLSIIDDYKPIAATATATATATHNNNNNNNNNNNKQRGSYRLIARKRRRRGSRSVSGRSSDRSGTRRCCSVGASAAYGTCSDFPVAVGTDSSGELFGNGGDANWASDVSEARNSSRRERDEKESFVGVGVGVGFGVQFDGQGNESGYGSEPGYRGDAEFGYGDEFDEEEDDFGIGIGLGDTDSKMEVVGENTFSEQKAHYRCRRKKHDCRMVDSLR